MPTPDGPQFNDHVNRIKELMAMEKPDFKQSAKESALARLDVTRGTHGTVTQDGQAPDEIVPSSKFGRPIWSFSDPNRTYFTASNKHDVDDTLIDAPNRAGWTWAKLAQKESGLRNRDAPLPRMVNLEVEPQGTIDIDQNANISGKSNEMTADSLKVKNVDWIPNPSETSVNVGIEGVQGTLPNENWNKYDKYGGRRGDANFLELWPKKNKEE